MTRFPLLVTLALTLPLTACISADTADTADSFDSSASSTDVAQVAFVTTCDSSGYWAIAPEAQAEVWDTLAIEVHGVVVGGVPGFWSTATATECAPVLTAFTCDASIQVRVRLELDGADIATACSSGASAWASCPETLPPVC